MHWMSLLVGFIALTALNELESKSVLGHQSFMLISVFAACGWAPLFYYIEYRLFHLSAYILLGSRNFLKYMSSITERVTACHRRGRNVCQKWKYVLLFTTDCRQLRKTWKKKTTIPIKVPNIYVSSVSQEVSVIFQLSSLKCLCRVNCYFLSVGDSLTGLCVNIYKNVCYCLFRQLCEHVSLYWLQILHKVGSQQCCCFAVLSRSWGELFFFTALLLSSATFAVQW